MPHCRPPKSPSNALSLFSDATLTELAASAMSSSSVQGARLLRGSLSSRPGPGGPTGSYVLPCRKLVVEYCPHGESSRGTRNYLLKATALARSRLAAGANAGATSRSSAPSGKGKERQLDPSLGLEESRIVQLAREFPSCEVVVKEAPHKHPLARGFYSESHCVMLACASHAAGGADGHLRACSERANEGNLAAQLRGQLSIQDSGAFTCVKRAQDCQPQAQARREHQRVGARYLERASRATEAIVAQRSIGRDATRGSPG